jgi:hypothetical protein
VGNVFAETIVHVSVGTIVPLRLVDFFLKKQGKDVLVNWITSSEINTGDFEIERSIEGTHFITIASVPAAGNSNSLLNYHITDRDLRGGIYYYRLKLIDRDRRTTYYAIKTIAMNEAQQLIVFPNPVRDGRLIF